MLNKIRFEGEIVLHSEPMIRACLSSGALVRVNVSVFVHEPRTCFKQVENHVRNRPLPWKLNTFLPKMLPVGAHIDDVGGGGDAGVVPALPANTSWLDTVGALCATPPTPIAPPTPAA